MLRKAPKYLISITILTFLVGACSSSPTGRSQLTLKSEAALAQEGARQFAIIREQMPMVQDQATIDYVACVANAIVDVLESPDADMYWELAVIDKADINAFVMPGGKISVFSGILTVAENQHQLAAVMGHEVRACLPRITLMNAHHAPALPELASMSQLSFWAAAIHSRPRARKPS